MKRSTYQKIISLGDNWYCTGMDLSKKPECLGWEAKVKSGEFGKPEFEAHKAADTAFGKHYGIYEALRLIERYEEIEDDISGKKERQEEERE